MHENAADENLQGAGNKVGSKAGAVKSEQITEG